MSTVRSGVLALFLVLVLGGGFAIGFFTRPGAWYAGLSKPAFVPPDWLFPVAWTILYALIAIAGARTFERNRTGKLMKLWWLQLALNFLWPVIFFVAHQIGLAFAVIVLLLTVILAFIGSAAYRDGIAAWLFAPYAAWVTFAAVLNGFILAAN